MPSFELPRPKRLGLPCLFVMLIRAIEWQTVAVPFKHPFRTSSSLIDTRHSLIVWIETDDGLLGVGEAPASLVRGHSSLRFIATALETVAPALLNRPLASAPLSAVPPLPLAFALETAAFDCLSQSTGKSLTEFLGGSPRPVEVNAVIGEATPAETEALAVQAADEGFRTVKLKVGGRPSSLDEEALSRVRRNVGRSVKLRLDANQAWPEPQAALALQHLARYSPEYIEEPLASPSTDSLARLRKTSPIPIAVDESVENPQAAEALADSAAVDFLIIKLERVGGISVARSIFDHARTRQLGVVLTSSLESGVGLAAAAHLAAALDIPQACGLATSTLLTHDLLQAPLVPTKGLLPTLDSPGIGIALDPDAIQHFALGPRGRAQL